MNAPNRAGDVTLWVNTHRSLFVGGGNPDDIRRELLIPLARHLNALEGRDVWGRLVKSERRPPFIPHDILMWKDTREHFDVFTGAERIEDTRPTWGVKGIPYDPRWIWQSVGVGEEPPGPVDPPAPPADDELKARVQVLEATASSQATLIRDALDLYASASTRLQAIEERVKTLEDRPTGELPDLVAEGTTSRDWGHGHRVRLPVRRA